MGEILSFKYYPITKEAVVFFNPIWLPLEKALTKEKCRGFMFMASYEMENGILIHTYKYYANREYINLSDDGRAWKYHGEGYTEIDAKTAIDEALSWVQEFSLPSFII